MRSILQGGAWGVAWVLLQLSAQQASAVDHRLCSKFMGHEVWRVTEVGFTDRGGTVLHPNRKHYLSYENEGFQEVVRFPLSYSFLQTSSPSEMRTLIRRRANGDLESVELTQNATKALLTENARRKLKGEKYLADRVSRLVRYRFEEKNGFCVPSEVSVEAFDNPGMVESSVVRTVVMNLALCREIEGVQRSKEFGKNWEADSQALRTIWFKYQKAYEMQHASLQAFEGHSRAEWKPNLFELGRMFSLSCESLDLGYGFPMGQSVSEVLSNEEVYPLPAARAGTAATKSAPLPQAAAAPKTPPSATPRPAEKKQPAKPASDELQINDDF